MRRSILLILTAVLLIFLPAIASAASCTLCGSETGSDDYLCTDCFLQLLGTEKEEVPLSITGTVQNENGTVTVTWTDDAGNAPYQVRYELLEKAPTPFGWTAAEAVNGNSCTLDRLVPGVSYIISVIDSKGQSAETTWFAPVPGEAERIGAKIRLKPMLRVDRSSKRQKSFSAAEICGDTGSEHGLYLRLTYSTLKRTRNYAFQIAVEAPNDFADVIFSGTLELHHGKSSIPVWGFIPLDDYFALLKTYYGSVPTGEYDVTLYFDGHEVWTAPFTVAE